MEPEGWADAELEARAALTRRHLRLMLRACLPIALLAGAFSPLSRAQELLSGDEQNVVNFAFATQLGSGVYSVSGRTLQIYRLPFGHTLKSTDDSGFGIKLTLPVTLGFLDFELQDVANGTLGHQCPDPANKPTVMDRVIEMFPYTIELALGASRAQLRRGFIAFGRKTRVTRSTFELQTHRADHGQRRVERAGRQQE